MARPAGLRANGAIDVSVFVKVDSSTSDRVIQASSGDFPLGISQEFAGLAPIPGASTKATNAAGEQIAVYSVGEICLLQASTAGWTAGDKLKPQVSTGFGITASTGDYYGAIALETLSGSGAGRVLVIIGKL